MCSGWINTVCGWGRKGQIEMRDEARKGNGVTLCGVWGLTCGSPHLPETPLAETAWAFFFLHCIFISLLPPLPISTPSDSVVPFETSGLGSLPAPTLTSYAGFRHSCPLCIFVSMSGNGDVLAFLGERVRLQWVTPENWLRVCPVSPHTGARVQQSWNLSTSSSPPVASPVCLGSHAAPKGRKRVRNKFKSPGGSWPPAELAAFLLLDPLWTQAKDS